MFTDKTCYLTYFFFAYLLAAIHCIIHWAYSQEITYRPILNPKLASFLVLGGQTWQCSFGSFASIKRCQHLGVYHKLVFIGPFISHMHGIFQALIWFDPWIFTSSGFHATRSLGPYSKPRFIGIQFLLVVAQQFAHFPGQSGPKAGQMFD